MNESHHSWLISCCCFGFLFCFFTCLIIEEKCSFLAKRPACEFFIRYLRMLPVNFLQVDCRFSVHTLPYAFGLIYSSTKLMNLWIENRWKQNETKLFCRHYMHTSIVIYVNSYRRITNRLFTSIQNERNALPDKAMADPDVFLQFELKHFDAHRKLLIRKPIAKLEFQRYNTRARTILTAVISKRIRNFSEKST